MIHRVIFVALLCFVIGVNCQNEDKFTIDDFSGLTDGLLIVTPEGSFSPITTTASTQGNGIIGGERDLILTAEEGSLSVFNALVSDGQWSVDTPNGASGFSIMQYDGTDGSSSLDRNGLGGFDLTANRANGFRLVVSTDIDTVLAITVYNSGSECSFNVPVEGEINVDQEKIVLYSSFSGSCDFSNVGAIEILIEAFDNVDVVTKIFNTYGPEGEAPSASSSPIPPSASNSPIPASASSTPIPPSATQTPAPSPEFSSPETNNCECDCPAFQCGLVFARWEDDDDGADDEDDDDFIYRPVYYGAIDDDFDDITGDDDDNEHISIMGHLTRNDPDSNSPASVLSVTFAMLVVVVAMI